MGFDTTDKPLKFKKFQILTLYTTAAVCFLSVAFAPSHCLANETPVPSLTFSADLTTWAQFTARKEQIESAIDLALGAKQISTDQCREFREELARIANAADSLKSAGKQPSFTLLLPFSRDLDNLASRLQQLNSDSQQPLPDLSAVRAQIEQQLNGALSNGILSMADATEIRHDLDHVKELEEAFMASGEAKLTVKQARILSEDLNKVRSELEHQIHLGEAAAPEIRKKKALVENRIQQETTAGRISAWQTTELKQEIGRLVTLQTAYINSEGSLSPAHVQSLSTEYDKILEKLVVWAKAITHTHEVATPPPTTATETELETRLKALRQTVSEIRSKGLFSKDATEDLQREIDLIESLVNAYKNSENGLTTNHIKQLNTQIDGVHHRIESAKASKSKAASH